MIDRKPFNASGRLAAVIVLALVVASVAVVAGGCAGRRTSGDPTRTGFFPGYDVGDEEDRAENRKSRPEYRPNE